MGTGALHSILLISNATGSTIPYGGGALLFPFTILFSGVTDATGYKALVVVIRADSRDSPSTRSSSTSIT
jgi:hypothetical protein